MNLISRRPLWMLLCFALTTAPAAADDGVAGPFLAGRHAATEFDYAAASNFYTRALLSDPSNPVFLEQAITARLALGELDRALPLAEQSERLKIRSQAASMVRLGILTRDEDYAGIVAELDAGRGLGELTDGLLRAWAQLGMGQMSDATKTFDDLVANEPTAAFGLYHKALALASVGDFEGAEAILSGEAAGPMRATRRTLLAHVEVLSQLEKKDAAIDLIDQAFGGDLDPTVAAMRASLEAGEALPFTIVRSPKDGIAETFFTLAAAMNIEGTDAYGLGFARLAAEVRPGFTDAILLAAGMLEDQGQYDLANGVYSAIPREDPSYHVAELGRAEALFNAGKSDAAIEVLEQLAKAYPDLPIVWTTLADALRREERFADAVAAYDQAIASFATEQPVQWVYYYARGISHERMKNWTAAEADFLTALRLNPDQPDVLNYLGYSYVELKTNLDEALAMIERAVAAQPDSGHIVDSLGWALYRLGRYDEAVGHMEKAVELMPVDPVVNDHLGDVYWAVGRRLEAEFQWKRALSFIDDPETAQDADPERIRRKIEVGLDQVLADEGAPPLAVSENGN